MRKYIISDPDILGGTPVIKGTRVPIGRLLFLLKDGYTLEAIQEDYPHIDIPTATLLEHALLTQGFMGESKADFHRRLRLQNRDFTCTNLIKVPK